MNRSEYLQWCKNRALAYVDAGELHEAFTSMCSDIEDHPETKHHAATNELGMMQLMRGMLNTPAAMRGWIMGYN